MKTPERERFDAEVAKALGDRRLQDWLADFQRLGQEAYVEAMGELDDTEAWRDALSELRAHTVAHLDRYVDEFTSNVEANGGTVFFAARRRRRARTCSASRAPSPRAAWSRRSPWSPRRSA